MRARFHELVGRHPEARCVLPPRSLTADNMLPLPGPARFLSGLPGSIPACWWGGQGARRLARGISKLEGTAALLYLRGRRWTASEVRGSNPGDLAS